MCLTESSAECSATFWGTLFSKNGPISKALKGYESRPEQLEMAEAIARALRNKEHLIVEAGTGVGKSLAYLVPLIEWLLHSDGSGGTSRRAVVSTYTKTLQRQLVEKDLPLLRDNIFEDLRFALCLGGENYLCLRRLELVKTHGLFDTDEKAEIDHLLRWAGKTSTGIRTDIDISSSLWQKVCRESDLCYGRECKRYDACLYQKAKAVERRSHILVTNHHLFFANVASGWNALPAFDCAVFDEAHELEDVAADYLGLEVSNFRLRHLLDSIISPQGRGLLLRLKWLSQGGLSEISGVSSIVRMRGEAFFNGLSELLQDSSRLRIRERGFLKDGLSDALIDLRDSLKRLADYSGDEDEKREIEALSLRCEAIALSLRAILEQGLDGHVYWAEREGKRLRLVATPIEIASVLKNGIFDAIPSILTSATLSVKGGFDYIKERLGLSDARTLLLRSPFNYKEQALIYVPGGINDPKTEGYEDSVIDHIRSILEITMGRTLVLFTSYSLLERAYEGIRIPGLKILKQGDSESYRLIQEFRGDRHSVLLGTYTFWQGIDIPGDDLQCVIITKLPFSVPDEPVTEARMEALERSGKNPFYHYQIPQAIILLKQGFGRLIRTRADRGVVAILDSRLMTKGYGVQFLKSLPECRVTSSLNDIERFFKDPRAAMG